MNVKTAILSVLEQSNEDPTDIVNGLRAFQESEQVLSSNHPRLIDKYPDQWVAVADGTVLANGKSLEHVLEEVATKGITPADVIVRFIERSHRTLIL